MLRAAFNWLVENRAGTAEIWIASDAQRSNWHPEDPRWKDLLAQLGGLTQKVRVRLLDLSQAAGRQRLHLPPGTGRAARSGEASELQFVLDLQRNRGSAGYPARHPDAGRRPHADARRASRASPCAGGAGSIWARAAGRLGQLRPAGRRQRARQHGLFCLWPGHAFAGRGGQRGRTPPARCNWPPPPAPPSRPSGFRQPNSPTPLSTASPSCSGRTPLPDGADADRVQSFVAEGGVVIFFPPGQADARQFNGLGWGDVQNAVEARGLSRLALE